MGPGKGGQGEFSLLVAESEEEDVDGDEYRAPPV